MTGFDNIIEDMNKRISKLFTNSTNFMINEKPAGIYVVSGITVLVIGTMIYTSKDNSEQDTSLTGVFGPFFQSSQQEQSENEYDEDPREENDYGDEESPQEEEEQPSQEEEEQPENDYGDEDNEQQSKENEDAQEEPPKEYNDGQDSPPPEDGEQREKYGGKSRRRRNSKKKTTLKRH